MTRNRFIYSFLRFDYNSSAELAILSKIWVNVLWRSIEVKKKIEM